MDKRYKSMTTELPQTPIMQCHHYQISYFTIVQNWMTFSQALSQAFTTLWCSLVADYKSLPKKGESSQKHSQNRLSAADIPATVCTSPHALSILLTGVAGPHRSVPQVAQPIHHKASVALRGSSTERSAQKGPELRFCEENMLLILPLFVKGPPKAQKSE